MNKAYKTYFLWNGIFLFLDLKSIKPTLIKERLDLILLLQSILLGNIHLFNLFKRMDSDELTSLFFAWS